MDITRIDISPKKKENSKDRDEVLKNKKELNFIVIYVLCPFLQRFLFNEKEWHPEFDLHFFMYAFLKNLNISKNMRTATVCWNVVRSISSIIQDVSGNIFNLVCNFLLYFLTVYIGREWQFYFYCFFYYKQLL